MKHQGCYCVLHLLIFLLQPSNAGGEKKTLLIGGMFPMSGGWAGGVGCRPATDLALQDVNNDPTILADYELKLMSVDSKCLPGLGLQKMYELLYDNQTKLVLLTGCSSVSTFVAQAAIMWNLIVLSYGSSSPALSDRKRFPTFFRTHPSATLNNPTRLMLFKKFNWKKIATVQQTEEVFTSTIKDLEEEIKEEAFYAGKNDEPIEIAVRQSFQTDPTNAVKSLKRQDARIIVGVFYEDMARKVFCQAFHEGLYGERHVWLIIGWYPDLWYEEKDDSIDCTPEQLKIALEGHLTTEVVQYNLDEEKITQSGITTAKFKERLTKALKNSTAKNDKSSLTSLAGFVEAPLAYDAVWALSIALNRTISELHSKGRLLEEFNYTDNFTKDAILSNLNRTDFEGVSGRVSFTSTGDRIAKTQIEQMQNGTYKVVGVYDYISSDLIWYGKDHWPGGKPPADRTIIKDKLLIISRILLYIMSSLSGLGIIFSLVSFIFNVCSMKYSTIKNSLPGLNSLIALGCLMCLACVPLFGIDGDWLKVVWFGTVCQIRTWMITLGFTLSYGVMFVKILYGWRISRCAKESKSSSNKRINELAISQSEPIAMLMLLLALDLTILGVWQGLDPQTRIVKEFGHKNPEMGDTRDIMYLPLLEHCSCRHMTIWTAVMYGYKGLLLVIGLFLAYETRSVKITAINDLRFVAMAVYNVVLLCVIAVPVTLIIPSQHNASFAFISIAIILCCYLTVGLIFIPQMVKICSKRLNMNEEDTQQSLIHSENEKRYEQLKETNEMLKQDIIQKEQRIKELHLVLQKQFTTQFSNDDAPQASTSTSSEENSNSNNDKVMQTESSEAIPSDTTLTGLRDEKSSLSNSPT